MSSPQNLSSSTAKPQDTTLDTTQTQEIKTTEQTTVAPTKKKDDVKVEEVFSANLPPPLTPTTLQDHVVSQHSIPTQQDSIVGLVASHEHVKQRAAPPDETPVEAKATTIDLEDDEQGYGLKELFQEPETAPSSEEEGFGLDTLYKEPEESSSQALATHYNPDLPVSSRKAQMDVFEALGFDEKETHELVQDETKAQKALQARENKPATESVWVLSRNDDDSPQFIHLQGNKSAQENAPTPEHMNQLEGGNPIIFHYGNVVKVLVPSEMPPPNADMAVWEKAKEQHLAKTQSYKEAIAKQFPGAKVVIVSVPLEMKNGMSLFQRLTNSVCVNLDITLPSTALKIDLPEITYPSGMHSTLKALKGVGPNAQTFSTTRQTEEEQVPVGPKISTDRKRKSDNDDAKLARQTQDRVEKRRKEMQDEVKRVRVLNERQEHIDSSKKDTNR